MKETAVEENEAYCVRFEVIPELKDALEKNRLSAPVEQRLNKSAHIRKILWEYVNKK